MLVICALHIPAGAAEATASRAALAGKDRAFRACKRRAARRTPPGTRRTACLQCESMDRTQKLPILSAARPPPLRAGTPGKPAAGRRLAALAAASHTQAICTRGRRNEYGVCRRAPHWRRAPGAPSVRRHSPVRPPGHHVVSTLPPPAASVTTTLRSSQLSNARCSSSCAPGPPPFEPRVSAPAGLRLVSSSLRWLARAARGRGAQEWAAPGRAARSRAQTRTA